MSNNNALRTFINNTIYENNTQQITGAILNTVLNSMVNTLGAGYQFAGVANVSTNPSEPDAKIFYIAGAGIYTHFNNIEVPQGKLGFLKWDTSWHLETIDGLGGGSNLTGYISVASVSELPEVGQPTLGYLVGTNLYLYVGEGGDTADGKYQNCGPFRGPQGAKGDAGNSIQSIVQTTTSTDDGGINIITVEIEGGGSATFQVRNGSKGSQGIQGPQGVRGDPGPMMARYKSVSTLPTASLETLDYIYLVPSESVGIYDMYYTEENQGEYSWQPLGDTAIQLSDYARKSELSRVEQAVSTISEEVIAIGNLVVDILKKAVYKSNDVGQEITALEQELIGQLLSIDAVYTPFEDIYVGQTLEEIRQGIVVTAHYLGGTSVVVNNYTLTGNLNAGANTITVEYGEKTDTIIVNVLPALYYREGKIYYKGALLSNPNQIGTASYITVDGVTYYYTQRGKTQFNYRSCYLYFDLLLTAGVEHTFKFYYSGLPEGKMFIVGLQYYNQSFYEDGLANVKVDHNNDMLDSLWITPTFNNGIATLVHTAPATSVGVRIVFLAVNESDLTTGITWPTGLTIDRFVINPNA